MPIILTQEQFLGRSCPNFGYPGGAQGRGDGSGQQQEKRQFVASDRDTFGAGQVRVERDGHERLTSEQENRTYDHG